VGTRIQLKGRSVTENGKVIFTEEGIFEYLYSGRLDLSGVVVEKDSVDIELFNTFSKIHDSVYDPIPIYDQSTDKPIEDLEWFIPEPYASLNIMEYVRNLCVRDDEIERVNYEMALYESLDLINLLRLMVYLVDTMRHNNIVWGIGRGSSVASYVLFLIGVHKVDSIRFKLDVTEFLKID